MTLTVIVEYQFVSVLILYIFECSAIYKILVAQAVAEASDIIIYVRDMYFTRFLFLLQVILT